MAITGVEYFSGGLFSSSTGTAARYFTDGIFTEDIVIPAGLVGIFVDGIITTSAADLTAEKIFSFGLFESVIAGGEGAELIWSHVLSAKKRQDQFLPI